MAMSGMDIEQVEALGRQLAQASQEIQQLAQRLSGQLESAPWVGADRDQFLGDWNGNHRPALQKVVEGLNAAGQAASRNATQQRETSQRG